MKNLPTTEVIESLKDEILEKSDNLEKLFAEIKSDLNEIRDYEHIDQEEISTIEEKVRILEKKYKI